MMLTEQQCDRLNSLLSQLEEVIDKHIKHIKHGNHDQSTHGRGRGGGGKKPPAKPMDAYEEYLASRKPAPSDPKPKPAKKPPKPKPEPKKPEQDAYEAYLAGKKPPVKPAEAEGKKPPKQEEGELDRNGARVRGDGQSHVALNQSGAVRKMNGQTERSLREYSGNELYGDINDALRKGKKPSEVPPQPVASDIQREAQKPLVKETVVYRGMLSKHADEILKSVKGNEIEMQGFVSTSTNPAVATGFSPPPKTVMEIKAKRGVSPRDVSEYSNEMEIIQAHGTRYRVVGVRNDQKVNGHSKVRVIEMEEV